MARDGELPGEERAGVHRVAGPQDRMDDLGEDGVEVDLVGDLEPLAEARADRRTR